MFLSEWRELPSALCLARKRNLMTARVSMLLKSSAYLTCFRACFLPGRAKDLPPPRYVHKICPMLKPCHTPMTCVLSLQCRLVLSYSNYMNFLPVLIILILVSNHVWVNKGLLKNYIGMPTWAQSACFAACIVSLSPSFVSTSIIIFILLN